MASRTDFFKRVDAVAIASSNAIAVDVLPLVDSHNIVSKMIRSALTVSTFSYLESYLENRVLEVMPKISRTRIPYQSLPIAFKKLVSVKAIQGIATRLQFEKDNQVGLAEHHINKLSNFNRKRHDYSSMGFSPTGSNILASHITDFMTDIGVALGWETLKGMTSAFTYKPLDLKIDFDNFSKARNSSAHDPLFNVPSNDLENHRRTAIRVGVAFDFIITFASECYMSATDLTTLNLNLKSGLPQVAIVKQDNNQTNWEVTFGNSTLGPFNNQRTAEIAAKRASRFAIVQDRNFIPTRVI